MRLVRQPLKFLNSILPHSFATDIMPLMVSHSPSTQPHAKTEQKAFHQPCGRTPTWHICSGCSCLWSSISRLHMFGFFQFLLLLLPSWSRACKYPWFVLLYLSAMPIYHLWCVSLLHRSSIGAVARTCSLIRSILSKPWDRLLLWTVPSVAVYSWLFSARDLISEHSSIKVNNISKHKVSHVFQIR